MAQAESISITTRRGMLTGTAAALALPATVVLAAPVVPDATLLSLGRKIRDLDESGASTYAAFHAAQDAMAAWHHRNPEPEFVRPIYRERKGDDPHEFFLRKRAWRLRREQAEIQCGYVDTKVARNALRQEIDDLCERVAETAATTLAGLRCKAALAVYSDAIVDSILSDLLILPTDIIGRA